MQCGPPRYRVDARAQASAQPFEHRVIPRTTSFTLPSALIKDPRPPIQQIYAALAADESRNDLIFDDVLQALEGKRSPVILTERKDHALILSERLSRFVRNVILLTGGMGVRQRQAVMRRLADIPPKEERVLNRYRSLYRRGLRRCSARSAFRQEGGRGLRLYRRCRTGARPHEREADQGLQEPRLFLWKEETAVLRGSDQGGLTFQLAD
jgi:hypothetical protein